MMRLERSILLGALFSFSGLLVAQTQLTATGPIPFTIFDRDNNGFISQQEFASTHADRLTLRAQMGYPVGGAVNTQFRNFDSNDDGKLTEKELLAGQHRQRLMNSAGPRGGRMGMGGWGRNMPTFNDFDINRDGVLKQDEFEQARAKRIRERVSQGYMMRNLANAPTFTSIDSDGNGLVTPNEFMAAQIAHRQQRF
jgi:Ca2+-binding EF-hand superfamily protein